jgi:hypothetical protein
LEVATGVNKSGLYSEFKDKGNLFMQSLRYYLESLEKKGLLTAEPLGWKNIERFWGSTWANWFPWKSPSIEKHLAGRGILDLFQLLRQVEIVPARTQDLIG